MLSSGMFLSIVGYYTSYLLVSSNLTTYPAHRHSHLTILTKQCVVYKSQTCVLYAQYAF